MRTNTQSHKAISTKRRQSVASVTHHLKGLVPECLSEVLCCSLQAMCHVCVTAQLIFIKRETKNPEVQLECLVEQSIQSSRANLSVCVHMSPLRILSRNTPANRHKGEFKKINKYMKEKISHILTTRAEICTAPYGRPSQHNITICMCVRVVITSLRVICTAEFSE